MASLKKALQHREVIAATPEPEKASAEDAAPRQIITPYEKLKLTLRQEMKAAALQADAMLRNERILAAKQPKGGAPNDNSNYFRGRANLCEDLFRKIREWEAIDG